MLHDYNVFLTDDFGSMVTVRIEDVSSITLSDKYITFYHWSDVVGSFRKGNVVGYSAED